MHIHCSACGASLARGWKACPACALPLTAIAMSTPPLRKKCVSLLAILFGCFAILWIVAYASDHVAAAHRPPPAVPASFSVDPGLEQRVEQSAWFSATRLHHWRAQIAQNLTEAERRQSEPGAQQVIADDHAALQRIDERLKELRAQ